MTKQEVDQYSAALGAALPIEKIFIPRRFTAITETGNVSLDIEHRFSGLLHDRDPQLGEILKHPKIAILADPGGGKSIIAREAVREIIRDGGRLPVFTELREYRGDLSLMLREAAGPIFDLGATVDGVQILRTYVFDGVDEIPAEMLGRLGRELQELLSRDPQAHVVLTARQAFYAANRNLLPAIPIVFHLVGFADDDIREYAAKAGISSEPFMDAVYSVGAVDEIRNPFVLSVMVERFRAAGGLSELRSENLSYIVDRLIGTRPQLNPHRQRRALRMLAVAMEAYSRNELAEEEAFRIIKDAMRISDDEARELLDGLYASILRRTGNGLAFQLASYGEYLAAEALEDAPMERIREVSFVDFRTPHESWLNTVSYLVELNQFARRWFVKHRPVWALPASPVAFSEYEKDTIVNEILRSMTANAEFVSHHPRVQARRLAKFVTQVTRSVLQKDLASQNDVVLGNALVLLGVLKDQQVVPLALEIVKDSGKGSSLRYCGIIALVNAGSSALVQELLGVEADGDQLRVNIVDAAGALADEAQLSDVLPVLIRTDAMLSASYYHFREFRSREAMTATLRYFADHPEDLNAMRTGAYVEPMFKLIATYWNREIAELIVDLIVGIETHRVWPDPAGFLKKLVEEVRMADKGGIVPRIYFERLIGSRIDPAEHRMGGTEEIVASLIKTDTANWMIEARATPLIQRFARYLQGTVRELLREHSDGIIDAQDQFARRYAEERAERERRQKDEIAALQEQLVSRHALNEALQDFSLLREEHWPEIPGDYSHWLSAEISAFLRQLDLERSIEWKGTTLWQPSVLPLLLALVDHYELRTEPDEPLVFAAMSMDPRAVPNHYRRFGLSDGGHRALVRLVRNPPSAKARYELVRFIETSGVWSDALDEALREVVLGLSSLGYVQVTALVLLAGHGVSDEFIDQIAKTATSEDLRRKAFDLLVERQHRPTIERNLARLLANTDELKGWEEGSLSQLGWLTRIKSDFAFDRLGQLREQALRLELPRVVGLISEVLAKINRGALARLIRDQLDMAPAGWRHAQKVHAIEQERTANIERAQRTAFDEVMKKLKGATSLNRLLVACEGSTDTPVFAELIRQVAELPEVLVEAVGGWPGLRNKDPNLLLLGCKAVIVVMDGDEGRHLNKHCQPLTRIAHQEERRLAASGIELHVLRRYGIENYFSQAAVEQVVRMDLSSYFPVPHQVSFLEHLSRDRKSFFYYFRRWVAQKLDLRMPTPREPIYSKSRNAEVCEAYVDK